MVLPDITFISNANSHIVKDHIYGIPDLIIEVLIKENHDLITKKDLYEKFGVKEYWIVDPANKSTIGYTLVKKNYQKIDSVSGKINSKLFNHSFEF